MNTAGTVQLVIKPIPSPPTAPEVQAPMEENKQEYIPETEPTAKAVKEEVKFEEDTPAEDLDEKPLAKIVSASRIARKEFKIKSAREEE